MPHGSAAFGLYPSTQALHAGAEALRAARFRHTDISVMYADGERALRLRESAAAERDVADEEPVSLAGVLTSLSGLGAVQMPGAGPFMAGGPILASLVGGAESLPRSLRGLGLPESDVALFEERLRGGSLLLSVQCDDPGWARRACDILQQTGAERVATA